MKTNVCYLGDCLDVLKTLPENSIDSIISDVPYNTGMKPNPNSTRLNSFFNDDLSKEDYKNLVEQSSKEIFRVLKNNKAIYIYINWKEYPIWKTTLEDVGFKIKNCIVWDKVVHGLNYMNYAYTHEFIIFAVKGKFLPNETRKNNDLYKDIWHIKRMMGKKRDDLKHETIKPLGVVEAPILHSTNENDIILDPFFGSGTTGVACQNLNRRFIGIEINEEYLPIIQARTGCEIVKTEPLNPENIVADLIEKEEKPQEIKDTCSCGGKIIKLKSGERCCEACLTDY